MATKEKTKKQEQDCKMRETIFSLFNSLPNPIWAATVGGDFVFFNNSWLAFRGKDVREELSGNWFNAVHEDDGANLDKKIKLAIKTGNSFETEMRIVNASGEYSWMNMKGNPLFNENGEQCGYFGSCNDITRIMEDREIINKEKEKLSLFLDLAGVFIVLVGVDQKVEMINKCGYETLGYAKRDDVLGKNWFDNFLPKDGIKSVKDVFDKIMLGDLASREYYENQIITKDGKSKTIAWHNNILRDKDGKILGSISSGDDITDRMEEDRRIISITHFNQEVIDQVPFGVLIIRKDGSIEFANKNTAELFGTSLESILKINVHDFKPYRDLGIDEKIGAVLKKNMPFKTDALHYHSFFEKKDSWRIFSGAPLFDENGLAEKIMLTIQDVTEERKKSEELEKINSLFVGRELKMLELKKELSKLKEKTNKK